MGDWKHKDVKFEAGDGIAYVTFNRPAENNTLNDTLHHGLSDALYALRNSKDKFRIAVFSGEGPMYCAGGDPKAWQAAALAAQGVKIEGDGTVGVRIPPAPDDPKCINYISKAVRKGLYGGAFPDGLEPSRLTAAMQWDYWATLPQFTIALVNGSAMGGGVGCACSCDYVIAVKKAFFVLSEVKIGVVPATISPYVLNKMGSSSGRRMMCSGENIKAEQAKQLGIVDEVVENMQEGHARIKQICALLSHCEPKALTAAKELCFATAGQPIAENVLFSAVGSSLAVNSSAEAKIGIEAATSGKAAPWASKGVHPLH